jgi:hypothetical protein
VDKERRELHRRDFSLYMNVLDEKTGLIIGTLLDISTGGFRLDSKRAIPLNTNIRLRINHTHEISNKKFISFVARARWCQRDPMDSFSYHTGFQIVDMTPADFDIFVQMFNSYGAQTKRNTQSGDDHFWE